MIITMDAIDLTQEELSFIKTRHATKQLAFALLFKCYQGSHQFIDDLQKYLVLLLINLLSYLMFLQQ